jgi:hypothetical protein
VLPFHLVHVLCNLVNEAPDFLHLGTKVKVKVKRGWLLPQVLLEGWKGV